MGLEVSSTQMVVDMRDILLIIKKMVRDWPWTKMEISNYNVFKKTSCSIQFQMVTQPQILFQNKAKKRNKVYYRRSLHKRSYKQLPTTNNLKPYNNHNQLQAELSYYHQFINQKITIYWTQLIFNNLLLYNSLNNNFL